MLHNVLILQISLQTIIKSLQYVVLNTEMSCMYTGLLIFGHLLLEPVVWNQVQSGINSNFQSQILHFGQFHFYIRKVCEKWLEN